MSVLRSTQCVPIWIQRWLVPNLCHAYHAKTGFQYPSLSHTHIESRNLLHWKNHSCR